MSESGNVQHRCVLSCRDLQKTFRDGAIDVQVLKNINLDIYAGERVAIVGASGEGKSTLLHLLGALEHPSCGEVFIDGEAINSMNEAKRSRVRNLKLGFVYQFHHLLPEFNVLENVCMPLLLRHDVSLDESIAHARALLRQVGLEQRIYHQIGELSGGERQRAAIARALITNPMCVLADEPTGNLDHATAENVYQTMLNLNKTMQTSFLIVTHDLHLASQMDRTLRLEGGELQEEKR